MHKGPWSTNNTPAACLKEAWLCDSTFAGVEQLTNNSHPTSMRSCLFPSMSIQQGIVYIHATLPPQTYTHIHVHSMYISSSVRAAVDLQHLACDVVGPRARQHQDGSSCFVCCAHTPQRQSAHCQAFQCITTWDAQLYLCVWVNPNTQKHAHIHRIHTQQQSNQVEQKQTLRW